MISEKKLWLLIALILLAACNTAPGPAASTALPASFQAAATPSTIQPAPATSQLQVAIVPSQITVGPNRFAVGLFDSTGRIYLDANVHFRYFDLTNPNSPALESEADAERLATPDGVTAIYAQERDFERAGDWGVEVQARFPDGATAVKGIAFKVVADSKTILPGDKAPKIQTPTAADVSGNLTLLTSAAIPNPAFYQLSLDKAVASGKPTVLLFSTPAFCVSRLCGPAYDTLSQVEKVYGEAANFIHVEVYMGLPNPAATGWQTAPAMQAFGLDSEPWVFFIDNTGAVVYRIEGLVTVDEIERHLKPLLGK